MIKEQRIKLASSELAYLEVGGVKTDNITIVFLHGWLDNAASFSAMLESCHSLMPEAHLLALDFAGHGKSAHRHVDSFYPFHDYIDDVHQFLEIMAPNRLVIVGHSLGALVGCCYSAAFAEKVDGLVQIEGFGPLDEDESYAVDRLRKGILSRKKTREKRQKNFKSLQDMVRLRATINNLTEKQIFPIVERASNFCDDSWQWMHDPKLQSDSLYRMSQSHAMTFIEGIKCQQTIILGNKGFEYLRTRADSYLSTIKVDDNQRINLKVLEGGHHCHLQHPELTSQLILDLVNKI